MTPILPHEYPVAMKDWAEADVDAAAAALIEIRNNPEKARERALHGKAFMEEHFSIANFKADIEKMLAK
jgi:glycosyltransferase involved in cell wall biosynthesis